MGGGSESYTTTQIYQPTPPPQPSTAEAIREYVASLPEIFQAQLEFAPQEAAQQLELAQQYALPFAETAREAQAALYPETTALQEQLAEEARVGMAEGAPQSVRESFLDEFRANLGTNVGSPIGAEATARGITELEEDFKRYYRNLALSVSGRQPLSQPVTPQYTNQLQQFSPSDVLNFKAQNFNTYAQAGRPIPIQQSYGSTRPSYIPDFSFAICWVAAEIFGGWFHPKTCAARNYVSNLAPKWFKRFYIKYGERIAKFISNKPLLKGMIQPLFNHFAVLGGYNGNKV